MVRDWAQLVADIRSTGKTLEQIAEHCGVDWRTVCYWAAGDHAPSGYAAVKLYLLHQQYEKSCMLREEKTG